ncbi:MAG: hypothetical protein ACKV1O_04925, partial [Saprospiraceae bacterium]
SNILPSGFMFSVMLTLPSNSNLYCAAIFAIFVANVHQIGAAPDENQALILDIHDHIYYQQLL